MDESSPKCLDRHLVVGCSVGYSGWDMSPTINSKYSLDTFFSKMVSDILGSSYHTNVCSSVYFSDNFRFNQLFEAKTRAVLGS